MTKEFFKQIDDHIDTFEKLKGSEGSIKDTISTCVESFNNNGKLIFCGNGGSASDAQHLAAEFLIRLRPTVNRDPIPAISLAQDTSTITACANDFDYSEIFVRTFKALAKPKDVLVGISTSGNSKNIIKVFNRRRWWR